MNSSFLASNAFMMQTDEIVGCERHNVQRRAEIQGLRAVCARPGWGTGILGI